MTPPPLYIHARLYTHTEMDERHKKPLSREVFESCLECMEFFSEQTSNAAKQLENCKRYFIMLRVIRLFPGIEQFGKSIALYCICSQATHSLLDHIRYHHIRNSSRLLQRILSVLHAGKFCYSCRRTDTQYAPECI